MQPTPSRQTNCGSHGSGKILPPAAPIAGISGRRDYKNSIVYRVFRDGTGLADQTA
jgi:hypothetical protein